MLVTYTHITPRDDSPIRKVMVDIFISSSFSSRWLAPLAGWLAPAFTLPPSLPLSQMSVTNIPSGVRGRRGAFPLVRPSFASVDAPFLPSSVSSRIFGGSKGGRQPRVEPERSFLSAYAPKVPIAGLATITQLSPQFFLTFSKD